MASELLLAALAPNAIKGVVLIFFVTFFFVLLLRLVFGSKASFDRSAQIPLHDNRIVEPREGNTHG